MGTVLLGGGGHDDRGALAVLDRVLDLGPGHPLDKDLGGIHPEGIVSAGLRCLISGRVEAGRPVDQAKSGSRPALFWSEAMAESEGPSENRLAASRNFGSSSTSPTLLRNT